MGDGIPIDEDDVTVPPLITALRELVAKLAAYFTLEPGRAPAEKICALIPMLGTTYVWTEFGTA